jgi:Secretion system C-terminal sorting domain
MKKYLLSAILLGTAVGAQAQIIYSNDFEAPAHSLGNMVTGPISGTEYPCQNNFNLIERNSGDYSAAANYQIEAGTGTNTTNVFRMSGIAGSATKKGLNFFTNFSAQWTNRTPGNDVIEMEFDVWVPPTTTSADYLHVRLAEIAVPPAIQSKLAGIALSNRATTTTLLRGLSYQTANDQTIKNLTGSNASGIPKSTWQKVKLSYNPIDGQVIAETGGVLNKGTSAIGLIPAYLEIDYRNDGGTAADGISLTKIDNIIIRATPVSTLGTKEIYRENNDVAVYLNQNQLEVATKVAVKTLEVYNLAGQLVASANGNSVDVSTLGKGVYVAKYSDNKNTYSKRFVK